jgi:hypothetical protein
MAEIPKTPPKQRIALGSPTFDKIMVERGGAQIVYPTQPFKHGYKVYWLDSKPPNFNRQLPLSDKEISLIKKFMDDEWDLQKFEKKDLQRLKTRLQQRCNIQNPNDLTWEDILDHIREHELATSDTKTNAAKNNSTPQTQEQQLAIQIINALKEWISVGSIENWINRGSIFEDILKRRFCENVPKEYHPNHYLKFRISICNKLWMDSIILKLKAKGKDGLAEEIEQRQNKFIAEVNAIDRNLEPTNLMHLPNLQLNSSAARLINALKEALPYLGPQPASGGQSIDSQNKHEDIIDIKPNIFGIGLNINALIRKIKGLIKIKNVWRSFFKSIRQRLWRS